MRACTGCEFGSRARHARRTIRIEPGDVVTAVDDTPIYDADGLVLRWASCRPTPLRLSVLRGGGARPSRSR